MIIIRIKAGLGNQLFQYATARSLSIKYNREIRFDLSFYNDPRYSNMYRLDKYSIDIKPLGIDTQEIQKGVHNPGIPRKIIRSIGLEGDIYGQMPIGDQNIETLFTKQKKLPKKVYLEGWFANVDNFKNIRELLIKELKPKESAISSKWVSKINNSNSVAIHVRRGDYIKNNYFFDLPESYYRKAIYHLTGKFKNLEFFFFSNDIDYVKTTFYDIKNSHYVDNTSDVEDLYLISLCNHQIIANSTFSWWGAWLNLYNKKTIIAPKNWYNDPEAQRKYEMGALVPENWKKK